MPLWEAGSARRRFSSQARPPRANRPWPVASPARPAVSSSNTDSMQVYADLRVLSARPTRAEEAAVPHAALRPCGRGDELLPRPFRPRCGSPARGGRGPGCPSSSAAPASISAPSNRASRKLPPVPEAIRAEIRREAEGRPTEALHEDHRPSRSRGRGGRLRPERPMRVMRALEILRRHRPPHRELLRATPCQGRWRAGAWSSCSSPPTGGPARADRCPLPHDDSRPGARRGGGAPRPAARSMLPVMRARAGVPGLIAHLDGTLGLEEAIARGQADTRAYAKRNSRGSATRWAGMRWVDPEDAAAGLLLEERRLPQSRRSCP